MLTIPVLFLAGAFLALRLAGGWDGLVESVYGRLLLFKLLFAILALSVGVFNKFHVVKLLSSEFAKGQQYLRTTLKIDAFIFMIIIGLIAWATTINGPQNL